MRRIVGLTIFGLGLAALGWLGAVSFRATPPWSHLLTLLGMPLMLLLVLAAACVVFCGAKLLLRDPAHEDRQTLP
jgi:hypothetical protein